ncbi:MAG: hypothetical protein RL386_753 [Bacteroidota bacterium]|jgi:hypothetical protein
MKGKTIAGSIVLLSALVALVVYLYVLYSGKIDFRPPIFHFDINGVTTLSLSSAQEDLIFAKGEQGWTVSDGKREGFFIPGQEVNAVLKDLNDLSPKAMWTGHISPYRSQGTPNPQVVKVRLLFHNRAPETFWVEKPNTADRGANLQIDGQEEIFSVPAASMAFCFRPFSYYQNRTFAFPPPIDRADSLTFIAAGDSLPTLFFRTRADWQVFRADTLRPDPLAFSEWWAQLGRFAAPTPSQDFDEVQEARLPATTLTFWAKGRPLLELKGFSRSYPSRPIFVHSSQRPGDYFACDSTGIFKQIFIALDSIIQQSVKL